jgi:hypothetical protein
MDEADVSPLVARPLVLPGVDLAVMPICAGSGRILQEDQGIRLSLDATSGEKDGTVPYCNAQLDDYHVDDVMRWQPPVRLGVRARFSHGAEQLLGTAGFGFWNDPLGMTGNKRLRLPQAVWYFFASPPTDLAFALDVPGNGWKAATLDAATPLTLLLSPLAPLAFVALRWGWLYRKLWPIAQRLWRIDERPLDMDLRQWHDYELTWTKHQVTWQVDGACTFRSTRAPKGPLGLVVWIDNQFMVATPHGRFRHGTLATGPQWLEIEWLAVHPL